MVLKLTHLLKSLFPQRVFVWFAAEAPFLPPTRRTSWHGGLPFISYLKHKRRLKFIFNLFSNHMKRREGEIILSNLLRAGKRLVSLAADARHRAPRESTGSRVNRIN